MTKLTTSLLSRLQAIDTPTICNAVELFDVRERNQGFGNGDVRAAFPEMPPVTGIACTATFQAGGPQSGGDPYGKVESLLELLSDSVLPSIVVIEDQDRWPAGAIFGEVMCSVYKNLGALGLITSGAGRDIDRVRALSFPVFLRQTIAAHAYCHAVEVGQPVNVAGLQVRNGDLIHADANGFAVIPLEIVHELPDAAAEYLRCEAIVLDACHDGRKTARQLTTARREMVDGLKKLRQRFSRREASV